MPSLGPTFEWHHWNVLTRKNVELLKFTQELSFFNDSRKEINDSKEFLHSPVMINLLGREPMRLDPSHS